MGTLRRVDSIATPAAAATQQGGRTVLVRHLNAAPLLTGGGGPENRTVLPADTAPALRSAPSWVAASLATTLGVGAAVAAATRAADEDGGEGQRGGKDLRWQLAAARRELAEAEAVVAANRAQVQALRKRLALLQQ